MILQDQGKSLDMLAEMRSMFNSSNPIFGGAGPYGDNVVCYWKGRLMPVPGMSQSPTWLTAVSKSEPKGAGVAKAEHPAAQEATARATLRQRPNDPQAYLRLGWCSTCKAITPKRNPTRIRRLSSIPMIPMARQPRRNPSGQGVVRSG